MVYRFLVSIAACVCAYAQAVPTDVFQKASPDVEQALRSQVSRFLQAHVDGKFRAASAFVAEDSQDFYFEMKKKRYLGFEIVKIDYADQFTKAKVLATVEVMYQPSARFQPMKVKAPYLMTWKLENGEWSWYSVRSSEWDTPWGTMKFGKDTADPTAKVLNEIRNMNGGAILAKLQVSKSTVELRCWEDSEDFVEITNGLQGQINLRLEKSGVAGLSISADKVVLNPGEVARVTFQYKPVIKNPRPDSQETIRIEPTGQTFDFTVKFAVQVAK